MGLFGFLKKKPKEAEIELPPPPKPPEAEAALPPEEDIPAIRPGMPPAPAGAMPEPVDIARPPMPMTAAELPMPEEYEMPPTEEEVYVEETPAETPAKVYDKTIKEFFPTREEIIIPKEIKPMFVAVDEYKDLASANNMIRAKLMQAEEYVARLSDLKNQKEKVFEKWRKLLEDAEKKMSYVDAVIEKAQG